MQFDARAAKSLAPKELMKIAGYPGLRLTATENYRTWVYRYKSPIDGRMRQVKLGRWPAMSLPAAIVAWEPLAAERAKGIDVALAKREERQNARREAEAKRAARKTSVYTVKKLCDEWVAHVTRVRKEKGAKEVRRLFETMVVPIENMPVAEVTRSVAFNLIESYASTPVVAGNLRAELGGAWDHALDGGKLPDNTPNWWRLVLRGKLRSKGRTIQGEHVGLSKRVLTEDELRQLLPWLPNFSKQICDLLTLYLWTGARGAELVQMEANEISIENGVLWWTCPKSKTKNARHQNATDLRVPLFGRARAVVERRLGVISDGYLFPSRGAVGHIEQKAIGVAVWFHMPYSQTRPQSMRPRLPVTRWGPHDLRRTVRTQLAAMGCPGDVAEAILGHMTGVYNRHKYDPERVEWLRRWDERLEEISSSSGDR